MSGQCAAPAHGQAGPGEVAATRPLGAKRRASRSALMGYQVMLRGDSPSAASPAQTASDHHQNPTTLTPIS